MFNPTKLAAQDAAEATSGPATRRFDFRPAFLDCATMQIYLSRFADGRVAPLHIPDGLPDEVVTERTPSGRVARVKATLVSGFERHGFFYTRTAAARACREWAPPPLRHHD